MSTPQTNKYIITSDKFFLDGKDRLMFTITTQYGIHIRLNQHLPLISRHYLKVIARIVGIYVGRKWTKTIINELTDKIDFQIPENLLAYRLHWACNPVQRYWRNTNSSPTRGGLRIKCKRYSPMDFLQWPLSKLLMSKYPIHPLLKEFMFGLRKITLSVFYIFLIFLLLGRDPEKKFTKLDRNP